MATLQLIVELPVQVIFGIANRKHGWSCLETPIDMVIICIMVNNAGLSFMRDQSFLFININYKFAQIFNTKMENNKCLEL